MSVNSALKNERNYQTAARARGPLDGPGHFEAVPDPDKEVAPDTVAHRLNWIPDVGTGVTVAFLFTNRAIAQALVNRLNGGRP